MQRFAGVLVLAAVAACSSGSGGVGSGATDAGGAVTLMDGFDPGPAPDPSQGFQLITPIVDDIEPDGSYEYCTDTNYVVPQDIWVSSMQGIQSETGHHVLIFYSPTPLAPNTHICAPEEMGEFQFGLPAGGGPTAAKFSLPGNLAVKIPAGSQIVINQHYLNASASPVAHAQSAVNVYYADPNAPHTQSSMMVVVDTTLNVPTGASTFSEDCTVNQTYTSWMQIPHMHSLGTHIAITYTPAATGTPAQLFDMDWTPDNALDFQSVATTEDLSKPFVFNAGDKIHVQCDYMNNTGQPAPFGTEMCVMANMTVDPNNLGSWSCDRGQWFAM